ncbi:hypothetical protein ACS0TY_028955 [Phlomoides rotata]
MVVVALLLGLNYSMQRPLKTVAIKSGDVYIPHGVSIPALDKDTLWEFSPKKIGEGDFLTGGDLYTTMFENTLVQHHVGLPPDTMGKVTAVAPPGQYSLKVRIKPDIAPVHQLYISPLGSI